MAASDPPAPPTSVCFASSLVPLVCVQVSEPSANSRVYLLHIYHCTQSRTSSTMQLGNCVRSDSTRRHTSDPGQVTSGHAVLGRGRLPISVRISISHFPAPQS